MSDSASRPHPIHAVPPDTVEAFLRKIESRYFDPTVGHDFVPRTKPEHVEEDLKAVRKKLLDAGWSPEDVDAVVSQLDPMVADPVALNRAECLSLRRQILDYLPSSEKEICAATPVAKAYTHQVNAITLRAPWGGDVILLDQALQNWVNVSVQCWWLILEKRIPAASEMLQDLLWWHAFGDVDHFWQMSHKYFRDQPTGNHRAIETWKILTTHFVMLHEVGHVVLGHLDQIVERAGSADNFEKRRKIESDADEFALSRMAARTDRSGRAFFPIFWFMTLMEISEVANPGGAASTHPSWSDRRTALRRVVPAAAVDGLVPMDAVFTAFRTGVSRWAAGDHPESSGGG